MRRRPAGREEEEELTNIYLSNLVKISAENLLAFAQPRVLKAEKSVTWGIGKNPSTHHLFGLIATQV